MAQPSGGGDGRLPRDRPGNSATLVATWRRVGVNYAVNSDAAETLVAEITTAVGRAIAVGADLAVSAAAEDEGYHTQAEPGPGSKFAQNTDVRSAGHSDTRR